jgi:Family of unknown function (DUF6662)
MAATLSPALADNRHFAFVYEAQTPKQGEIEYEQWLTWEHRSEEDRKLNVFSFRHELEYGITDRWMVALYAPDWEIRSGESFEHDGAHFSDVAVESIYRLSDPRTDWLGSAAYAELKLGDEVIELEPKLILQKNLGLFTLAYNIAPELEWEGPDWGDLEHNIVLQQTAGVSYELSPSWSIGAEAVHTIEWADWSVPEDDSLQIGPNVAFRHDRFWATLTPLFALVKNDEVAEFEVRLLFGIEF